MLEKTKKQTPQTWMIKWKIISNLDDLQHKSLYDSMIKDSGTGTQLSSPLHKPSIY